MLNSFFLLKRLRNDLASGGDELRRVQFKKLQGLIGHAYENVPYYRELFDSAGLSPRDIRKTGDIVHIPITDKGFFRGLDLNEKTAGNIDIDKCVKVFTSGSTGMPAHIYYTRYDNDVIQLAYLRSFLENGLRFRDKRAFVLDPHSFETKKCWYHQLGIAAYENISCFDKPAEQADKLRKIRPDFIHGYSSSLSLIADQVLDKGIDDIRPRIVSTSAELVDTKTRDRINSAFGVKLYDRYAARECGLIGWECHAHEGYHISIDTVLVEIVKENEPAPPGATGDVVVTNLHSSAMPFIRYKVGDIGALSTEPCGCGDEIPMMRTVEGRDEDFIILKNGKVIAPMMVTGSLDYVSGIKQFRVVQESLESINVLLAKGKDFRPEAANQAEARLKEILGDDIKIRSTVLDDISPERSGKVRAVVSKISGGDG